MTALVRKQNPDCTIFYNAGHVGPCTRCQPGRIHPFRAGKPSLRRMGIPAFSRDGSLCQNSWIGLHGNDREISYGMGRFSLSENQAALEFECFRMLSYGYAVSIGDQLEPMGF